jgi:hypothetical protein
LSQSTLVSVAAPVMVTVAFFSLKLTETDFTLGSFSRIPRTFLGQVLQVIPAIVTV